MIQQAPNDPKGHYLLGLSLRAQGKLPEATSEFETAVRLGPTLIEPIAQLVEMDLIAQRTDAALARVQRQISVVGDSARLVDLLGVVYAARGQAELAEKAFLKSSALQPTLADPLARLAQLYSSKGDDNAARAKAAEAIKLEPNNTAALMVLGLASQRRADPATARKYYEQALSVDSTSVVAANNLALLLAENGGSPVRALELAEVARAAAPDDPHVMDTYGWVLYRGGNYEKAISILRSSAARLANAPTVQYHFGMAAAKAGDTTTARRALALAINSSVAFPEKDAAKKALAALR
jgi:tetratricopeptide (TPR) repeat protein